MHSPCRLHVYLARRAPLGAVLRRGPAAWARLSLWRTDTDTFEHGQWIHARVFERRSDLSADGSLFITFIRTTAARLRAGQRADSWIAISRPPYFTALALWFVGGTYCTGGMFPEDRAVWLGWRAEPDTGNLPGWLARARTLPHIDRTNNWTDRTVFHNRLLRDGWQRVPGAQPETWRRHHPRRQRSLLLTERGWDARAYGGPHLVEYAVETTDGAVQALPGATWADWDHSGRMVLVKDGQLVLWEGPDALRVLADFNAQEPQPTAAPAWALEWPAYSR